ncbi:hypothetical protein Hbl1158_10335 [Halobaculum sp. CBA1158]|uniref:hypothetical protein n=1 Tax=Halobaculum sp. CBA1158 TaxID=2904243 RepID=UPI001F1C0AD9|nr:hypothetical protein [Halobaculum sp. CBA1158]UIO98932.1 hypothetical protein Hbl1158_10335 [Halobaculum sp. CBA1158]
MTDAFELDTSQDTAPPALSCARCGDRVSPRALAGGVCPSCRGRDRGADPRQAMLEYHEVRLATDGGTVAATSDEHDKGTTHAVFESGCPACDNPPAERGHVFARYSIGPASGETECDYCGTVFEADTGEVVDRA